MSDDHTQPTPVQIRAAVEPLFAYDERLRAVEVDTAALKVLPAEFIRMEDRLVAAIEKNAPKSPWPAVSAITGAVAFLFVLAAAIYTR